MKHKLIALLCCAVSTILIIAYGISAIIAKIVHANIYWLKTDYFYIVALSYVIVLLIITLAYIYEAGKAIKETYNNLDDKEKATTNKYIFKSIKIIGKYILKSLKKKKGNIGKFAQYIEANM